MQTFKQTSLVKRKTQKRFIIISSILAKQKNEGEQAFSLKYEADDSSRWDDMVEIQIK